MLNSAISNDDFVQKLLDAAKKKDIAAIKALCKVKPISTLNSHEKNAAMYIGRSGDEKDCQFFIEQGAQALDCAKGAAYGGHEKLARSLINNKAVHYPDLSYFAAWGGQVKTTASLLNATRTLKIDHVAICDTIASHAEKGGHKDMVQKYKTLAKVRAAKADAKKELSSDESAASEKSQEKPEKQTPVQSTVAKSAALQLVELSTPKPAAVQQPTLPERTMQSTPVRSVAALNSVRQLEEGEVEELPSFPKRFAVPTRLAKPLASLAKDTPAAVVPAMKTVNRDNAAVGLKTVPAASSNLSAKRSVGEKDVGDPVSAPLAPMYEAKRQRSKSPESAPQISFTTPVVEKPRTLDEALAEIQKLNAKVAELERKNAMLNIGLNNKQREVGDLRALITGSAPAPTGSPTSVARKKFQ